jgi:hypothetical protein
MAYPTTKVEIGFGSGPYVLNPTWTDVTTYVRNISIRRGGRQDFEQFPPGTAQLTLDNTDGRFTPFNTSGAYTPNIVPRVQIRITADAGSGYVAVFRGFVAGWPVSWTNAGKDSTVTISCFDSLALLADIDIPIDWSYTTISALSPVHWYRGTDPEGSSIITDIGSAPVNLSQNAAYVALAGNFRDYDSLTDGLPFKSINTRALSQFTTQNFYSSPATSSTTMSMAGWFAIVTPQSTSFFFQIQYGAEIVISLNSDGSLYATFNNGTTTYIMANSTIKGFDGFIPHHIAVTYDRTANSKIIYIDGKDVTGTFTSTASTATNNDYVGLGAVVFQELAVFSSILSQAQITALYNSGLPIFTETTAARMTRLFQLTSLDSSLYSTIPSPFGTVSEIGVGGSIVTELQKTTDSEGGDIFTSKAGVLTATNRFYNVVQGSATTSAAATFTDTGASLPYGQELEMFYDADSIRNEVRIQYASGAEYISTNTTSITAYGKSTATINTYLSTTAEAQTLADAQAGTGGTIVPVFSALEVSNTTSSANWATLLGLELLSKITLTRTPTSGTAITKSLLVDSIEHQITPSQWQTNIHGSARFVGWFTLDTSVLDGADILL